MREAFAMRRLTVARIGEASTAAAAAAAAAAANGENDENGKHMTAKQEEEEELESPARPRLARCRPGCLEMPFRRQQAAAVPPRRLEITSLREGPPAVWCHQELWEQERGRETTQQRSAGIAGGWGEEDRLTHDS